jgi:hypothetical protein
MHTGLMLAGASLAWVPPEGWPVPPIGWSPPPGWLPDPQWPEPPAGWHFWQEQFDGARFIRTWRILLVALAGWVAGNVAMAIGLHRHAAAMRRFFFNARPGSSMTNPVLLVAGCALLLMIGIVIVGIAWHVTFGFARSGGLADAAVGVLLGTGLILDSWLLFRQSFLDFDRTRRSAAVAGAAAVVGVVLAIIAGVRCHQRLAQQPAVQNDQRSSTVQ